MPPRVLYLARLTSYVFCTCTLTRTSGGHDVCEKIRYILDIGGYVLDIGGAEGPPLDYFEVPPRSDAFFGADPRSDDLFC